MTFDAEKDYNGLINQSIIRYRPTIFRTQTDKRAKFFTKQISLHSTHCTYTRAVLRDNG